MKPSPGTTNDAAIIQRMQSMAAISADPVSTPASESAQPDKKTPVQTARVNEQSIVAKIIALLKGAA